MCWNTFQCCPDHETIDYPFILAWLCEGSCGIMLIQFTFVVWIEEKAQDHVPQHLLSEVQQKFGVSESLLQAIRLWVEFYLLCCNSYETA